VRNQPKLWNTRAGSGPRHVAFHPNRRWFYCIHELDSTIDIFDWSESGGWATINNYGRNPVSTVETKGTKNAAAEVAVSPDGRFVYASNRGEDTLVVFTVNPANGTLKLLQRIACGGKTPRHFTFATGARWLLVGNQDSASVTVFKRDAKTGMLTGPVHSTSLDSVMYTLVV
jgi:6-phosphogluconolactonase